MHQSKWMCLFFFFTLPPNCRGSQEKKTFSCFCRINETNEMVKKNWWIIYHGDDRWTSILKIIIMIIMIQCSSSSSSSWSFHLDCPKTGNAHRFIHLISKVWNEGMKNKNFFFIIFLLHHSPSYEFSMNYMEKKPKKKIPFIYPIHESDPYLWYNHSFTLLEWINTIWINNLFVLLMSFRSNQHFVFDLFIIHHHHHHHDERGLSKWMNFIRFFSLTHHHMDIINDFLMMMMMIEKGNFYYENNYHVYGNTKFF